MWFSQGCTIGCKECTGTSHESSSDLRIALSNNMIVKIGANGHTSVPLCSDGMEPTLNDPQLRTMNRGAVAGSVNDTYRCFGCRSGLRMDEILCSSIALCF